MNIYTSELDIPEFENLHIKEARTIWRKFYFINSDWFNLTVLIGPLFAGMATLITGFLGFSSDTSSFVSVFIGAYVGYEVHRQIMIWHLRPKIREHLRQSQNTTR
jgi:hypothetical protein